MQFIGLQCSAVQCQAVHYNEILYRKLLCMQLWVQPGINEHNIAQTDYRHDTQERGGGQWTETNWW